MALSQQEKDLLGIPSFVELSELDKGLPEEPSFSKLRVKKPGSKTRVVWKPNDAMREVHKRFLDYLFERLSPGKKFFPSAVGAVPDGSPLRNARLHSGHRYFFILDIKDAYGSVDIFSLAEGLSIFREEGDSIRPGAGDILPLYQFLSKYCSIKKKGLIQGAPSSPFLFNFYCEHRIDEYIRFHLRRGGRGIVYSRYLDDLTISSPRPISRKLRRTVRGIVEGAGFKVNERKARVLDLFKGPIVVNGIGIKKNGDLYLPRRMVRRLSGLLHVTSISSSAEQRDMLFGTLSTFVELMRDKQRRRFPLSATESGIWNRFLSHKRCRVYLEKGYWPSD